MSVSANSSVEQRRALLTEQRRALLDRRLQGGLLKRDQHDHIVARRENLSTLPVSFAQRRLWILHELERQLTAYNIPVAYRLVGRLDVASLQGALATIVARHESLRTNFQVIDEEPVQVIQRVKRFELPIVDVSHLGEPRESTISQVLRQEVERPFDLARDLMLRVLLLRVAEDTHILLVTLHHIAADGWSLGVLSRELSVLYNAFRRGEPSPLEPLPIQYADYAVWQRQQLQGEGLDRLLQYWRRRLDGVSTLELSNGPRPPRLSYRGDRHDFQLSSEVATALRQLSRTENVTLHMALLAAFQCVLMRYSGQHDIAIGMPTAGRSHAQLEPLIGFFVNTVVLRTDLSGHPTFRQLLHRVRQASLEAYDHQQLPFDQLVEALQPDRHPNSNPLFQVLFHFFNFAHYNLELQDLEVSRWHVPTRGVRFDLEVSFWERPEGIRGAIVHSRDVFDSDFIQRMMNHFQQLLEGIAADPDQRIDELPLLSEQERRQLLVEWNATDSDYPRDACVHQLFEEQVARTPDAIAVVFDDQQLTYRELNRRANRVARYLVAQRVGREELVGIYVERSPEMLIGLLGILKSGGVYVPLDPDYPVARLATILREARVRWVLTDHHLSGNLPVDVPCPRPLMLSNASAWANQDDDNLSLPRFPEHLAYVIFTSGSTGAPKGVQVRQQALTNFLHSLRRAPGITSDDVVVAVTTISFDIAGLELFLPLVVGARVSLASRKTAHDGQLLAQQVLTSRATVLQATPASWQMLIESGWSGSTGLRQFCGGEALPESLAQQLVRSGSELWNLYGPTETTIWSSVMRVDPDSVDIHLGRPINNTQLYTLDAQQHPVPWGVPGELYIGGDGLARGYLNRPDLTAEKFVPDPFSRERGQRLYRTGDVACYLPNGHLVYRGRIDRQVKVRGFRIELAEIEHSLRRHPQIDQAMVVAKEDPAGRRTLAAYLTVRSTPAPTSADLRSFLKSRLPDYMIPASFSLLEKFPSTTSGKIDARALSEREESSHFETVDVIPPRTPTEERLADIWRHILSAKSCGVRDDFFELGGDSLLLVRLLSAIEKDFGIRLSVDAMLRNPTIEQLALAIHEQSGRRSERESRMKIPFVCLSWGPMLMRHLDSSHAVHALSVDEAITLHGGRNMTIESIASACVDELRHVLPAGPYAISGYDSHAVVAYEVAQQLLARGECVPLLLLFDPALPGAMVKAGERIRRNLQQIRRKGAMAFVRGLAGRGVQSSRRSASLFSRIRGYRPAPYAGRLTLVASDEFDVHVAEKWRSLAINAVETLRVPGVRFSTFDQSSDGQIARLVSHCLEDLHQSVGGNHAEAGTQRFT